MNLEGCQQFELPCSADPRGSLTVVEGGRHVPFQIARIFFLYGVPDGAMRAGHALRTCQQLLIATSGSFDVVLEDATARRRVHLASSTTGLLIPARIWRELDNFSAGAVCLVLASEPYDAAGYYRTKEEYLTAMRQPLRNRARRSHPQVRHAG